MKWSWPSSHWEGPNSQHYCEGEIMSVNNPYISHKHTHKHTHTRVSDRKPSSSSTSSWEKKHQFRTGKYVKPCPITTATGLTNTGHFKPRDCSATTGLPHKCVVFTRWQNIFIFINLSLAGLARRGKARNAPPKNHPFVQGGIVKVHFKSN